MVLTIVKICITNVLNMGPRGPRGLGPWVPGAFGSITKQVEQISKMMILLYYHNIMLLYGDDTIVLS